MFDMFSGLCLLNAAQKMLLPDKIQKGHKMNDRKVKLQDLSKDRS